MAPRRLAQNNAAWILLIVIFYCVYPYYRRLTEFSHDDIVYNYVPFRQWFQSLIFDHRTFPLWDPYSGIGRFAEIWTVLPIDVLTPVERFFRLDFSVLFCIQIATVFFIAWWAFQLLRFGKDVALIGAIFFLFAPATSYFLPYYIHTWPYIFFFLNFCFLFRFIGTKDVRFLAGVIIASLLFSIGGKTELIYYSVVILSIAPVFVCSSESVPKKVRTIVLCWAALWGPLLIHAWYFNLVHLSLSESIRTSKLPFVLSEFVRSSAAIFEDQQLIALFLCLCILGIRKHLQRFVGKTTYVVIALVPVAYSVSLALPKIVDAYYIVGYVLAVIVAVVATRWKRLKLSDTVTSLLASQVIIYYFGRYGTGDLGELEILSSMHVSFRIVIIFFATLGIFWGKQTLLKRWCTIHIALVFILRKIGLVILSHLMGFLWLPARDNFLIDFPLAVLACMGYWHMLRLTLGLVRILPFSRGYYLWGCRLSHVFLLTIIVTIVTTHSRWKFERSERPRLLSDTIREDVVTWHEKMQSESGVPTRILNHFHNFGRITNLANLQEYQSTLTKRYARYSISQRLGIPLFTLTPDVGFTTNALTEHTEKLVKSTHQPLSSYAAVSKEHFYFNYVIRAVPPLECNQLRLLGVKFIETGDSVYNKPTAIDLNALYSLNNPEGTSLLPALNQKINKCGFERIQIGNQYFWRVSNPLPRAFFISGATEAQLLGLEMADLEVAGNKIQMKTGTHSVFTAWKSVHFIEYWPNKVILEIDSPSDGVLVLTDQYHPEWKATANGKPVHIFEAMHLLRGISLGPGRYLIEFKLPYPRPYLTIAICIIGFVLVVMVFLWHAPVWKFSLDKFSFKGYSLGVGANERGPT